LATTVLMPRKTQTGANIRKGTRIDWTIVFIAILLFKLVLKNIEGRLDKN